MDRFVFIMGWDVAITLLVVVPSWAPTIVCALQQPLFGSKSVLRCLDVCLSLEIGIPFSCGPTMIWSVGLRKSTCVFAGTSPAMNIIGFASLISCTTGWCPSSRGTFLTSIVPVTVVNPLGGLLNVWPCALPAMVLGGISADPVPRRPIPVSGLPGWLSIELCAGANACFGPIGRNVLRPFPVLVLVSLLQWFVEFFPLPAGWIMRLVSCGSLPPTSP